MSITQLTLHAVFSEVIISKLTKSSKILWRITICTLIWCLWFEQNRLKYDEGIFFSFIRFRHFFVMSLRESVSLIFSSSNYRSSTPMFMFLGISQFWPSAPIFLRAVWRPWEYPWIKFNTPLFGIRIM